jgi:hypothetical protein
MSPSRRQRDSSNEVNRQSQAHQESSKKLQGMACVGFHPSFKECPAPRGDVRSCPDAAARQYPVGPATAVPGIRDSRDSLATLWVAVLDQRQLVWPSLKDVAHVLALSTTEREVDVVGDTDNGLVRKPCARNRRGAENSRRRGEVYGTRPSTRTITQS